MHKTIIKYFSLSTHNLFGLQFDLFTILIKPCRNVLAFLSFKGLTQGYLLKTSMALNKYSIPRLKKYNDVITAETTTQILSLNLV